MDVQTFLAGNHALGLALVAVLAAIAARNRPFVRELARDPAALWRALARVALVLTAAFIVWTTLFDNWRQVIGEPYRLSREWASQRVEIDPTPESLRTVTYILLALSLVSVACLFARHIGAYGVQLLVLLGCLIFWGPLFVVRQRFDLALALTDEIASPGAIPGYVLYLLMTWAVDIAVIALSYGALLMLVALPVTLLLDLTRLRSPRTTNEATAFFTALGDRATTPDRRR